MIKSKFKRVTSLFLATLMCVTTFAGIGSTTAYAATGEKADVYMVDFPRDGDANYDGVWGHSNLTLKNGWHTGRSNFTNLKAIGSYSGNVAYCIEPGISLKVGQTMNKYDENYFNNLASNGVISGDEIRLFVGRILQYGYRGTISTSWRSQNEAAANSIAQAYATQLLIWETVIGERDVNFNHVSASGCSNVKDVINARHPLRNKIFSYYNSMVQSVQNHATIPSFCNKSSGSAKTIELEWNGSKYTTTLTDSNNVLSKYNFKASISGVNFSVNGNKLTVSMDTAPSKEFTITATKKNAVRRGVVVWSEGKHGQNSSVQDVVSYAQEVSDSINGYVKMKVSYGSCQIVKTSEDGKVDGINFTITGNGINQTVTTANGGKFQIDNLMPGIYTVTEQAYDKYEPQETHRVTVVAGQVAKVNFNNKLKRGDLQVVKSSEDNLVEGVKFHLFGTSLSGDAVDQYAVTDKNGVATFKDVLISGSEPYTLEEVDTAIRYVVPKNQTAPVKWKEVTTRNFNNILKKFTVTVTKSDAEKGEAQGNAKLSGAVYGIYKGETLVDKYVTDENGQFTTKEYVCDTDWTIRECLHKDVPKDMIDIIKNTKYSVHQMQVSLEFYEKGVPVQTIKEVMDKGEKPITMRRLYEEVLEQLNKVKKQIPEESEYVKALISQMDEVVAKINHQNERYDALNKKLSEIETSKDDEGVRERLVKENQDKDALINSQQNELNKAMLTFLDSTKDYKLYDEQNRVVTTQKGTELYTHYDKVESSVRERYEKVQKQQKKTAQKKTVTTKKAR